MHFLQKPTIWYGLEILFTNLWQILHFLSQDMDPCWLNIIDQNRSLPILKLVEKFIQLARFFCRNGPKLIFWSKMSNYLTKNAFFWLEPPTFSFQTRFFGFSVKFTTATDHLFENRSLNMRVKRRLNIQFLSRFEIVRPLKIQFLSRFGILFGPANKFWTIFDPNKKSQLLNKFNV